MSKFQIANIIANFSQYKEKGHTNSCNVLSISPLKEKGITNLQV